MRDARLLFLTRTTRLFAYGAISVILVLYLSDLGFSEGRIGLLLTLTLAGDTLVSLIMTTRADRWGRRKTLFAGSLLMALAGWVFASSSSFIPLLIAATLGVISPSGNEVGPFLPVEQAALTHVVAPRDRTRVFSWYSLAGSLATAAGSLAGGAAAGFLHSGQPGSLAGYRAVVLGYGFCGLVIAFIFLRLSPAIEAAPPAHIEGGSPSRLGLRHSGGVVWRLSGLFGLDAFGGGFVVQSLAAYWFHLRFGAEPAQLGEIFFGANILAGFSALMAAQLSRRFGLVNTMVFTHLPSNFLLILVPLMPNQTAAIFVLLLRFSISQMDVPTRQSYLMAVVRPEERSAAAGITGVSRTTGAALAPACAGMLLASPALLNFPFYLAGGLKIIYDLLLYRSFIGLKPPEEDGNAGRK